MVAFDALARAIISAARRGHLKKVRRLVEQDRGLLDVEFRGRTPLTAAAANGRAAVVRYLLDEGVPINQRAPGGEVAMTLACSKGRLKVVSLLLKRGVDAASRLYGWTPLMQASHGGHKSVARLLLAHGCGDIDERTCELGLTALHLACQEGMWHVVRLLLGAGADPCLEDYVERTPWVIAAKKRQSGCRGLLLVSCTSAHTHTHTHTSLSPSIPPCT
jgi:ankyrin repeat protein